VLREGSVVDATIVSAPSFTENEKGEHDGIGGPPEMQQTQRGYQWHFGIKMHINVDHTLALIHSIDTNSANVHDIVHSGKLLQGTERRVFVDAVYLGMQRRDDYQRRENVFRSSAERPGARKKLDAEKSEPVCVPKWSIPSGLKQVFGYSKVDYRRLAKNNNRLHLLTAFSNLFIDEYQYMLAEASALVFRQNCGKSAKKQTNNG